MGGLILDVIIAYLIKSVLRLRHAWASSKWQRVQAKVDSAWLGGGWVWDCPTAYVAYTYDFAGQKYSATDSKPFIISASATRRVESFKRGEMPVVRVNQMQPDRSVLVQRDQLT